MSGYNLPPDFIREFDGLRAKVQALETQPTNPVPTYTTANRPAASSVPYLVIYNTTSAAFEGSNGSAWLALS